MVRALAGDSTMTSFATSVCSLNLCAAMLLSAATVAPHPDNATPRRPQHGSGTVRAPRREDVGPERVRLSHGSEVEAFQVAEARVGGRRRPEVRAVVLDDVLLDL